MSWSWGGTQTDIKGSRDVLCSSNPRLISVEGGLRENRDQLTIQTRIGGGSRKRVFREGRRVFFGFWLNRNGEEMENHTNAQLVLTLITRPGTFHFISCPFFSAIKRIFCLLSRTMPL